MTSIPKKKKYFSKAHKQIEHFKRRMIERYKIFITNKEYNDLIRTLQSNDNKMFKFLYKQSNRVSIFEMDYNGQIIPVVYDKRTKNLVTALPLIDKDKEIEKIINFVINNKNKVGNYNGLAIMDLKRRLENIKGMIYLGGWNIRYYVVATNHFNLNIRIGFRNGFI